MDVPARPQDPQIAIVLARLKQLRERSKATQQEVGELEDLVRRYCVGENPAPQPPAGESRPQN